MYFSRVRVQPDIHKQTQLAKIITDNAYGKHRLLWDLFTNQTRRSHLFREEIACEQLGIRPGIRGEPLYYVVSSVRPKSDYPLFTVKTKTYQPELSPGDTLKFELRANPVVTRNGKKHDIVMDAQRNFLLSLCQEMNVRTMSRSPRKNDYKKALTNKGGQELNERLTNLLESDYRYAERLNHNLTLQEKLEWTLKANIDRTLEDWLVNQGQKKGFTILKDKYGNSKLQNSAYRWHALTVKSPKGKRAGFCSVDFTGDLEVTDAGTFRETLFNGIGRSKAFGCGLMLVKRM